MRESELPMSHERNLYLDTYLAEYAAFAGMTMINVSSKFKLSRKLVPEFSYLSLRGKRSS